MSIEEVEEVYLTVKEVLGEETLLEEIYSYFSTDIMGECLCDIARTWDIDI